MSVLHHHSAIFIPHGGGPCFWMEFPLPLRAWDELGTISPVCVASLRSGPKAFLVVTALGGGSADGQRQSQARHAVRLLRLPERPIS